MKSYNELFERLQKNEEIAKKFHEIEIKIFSILNFKNLFEVLLTEIQEQFGVPYAWISLIEKSAISNLVKTVANSEILKQRTRFINRKKFMDLVGNRQQPILINENLRHYIHLIPVDCSYPVRSMAVAPISFHSKIIGSLNQADFSKKRFQPGMDTSLLEQLAIKISLCLSNVIAHEKLQFMAYYDPLTGLLNRRVMESILKREFSRARRYKTKLSLVFIDVNNFKQVNDVFGHDAGDELLKYLASMLFEMSRESDVVTRFAGDEFVLILPETSASKTKIMMSRLQNYIGNHPFILESNIVPFSISFGIASTEDETICDPNMLLKRADVALYEKKKAQKLDVYSIA
jgi:diguanylate cyclase (GGDEF)-like protein